MQVHGQNSTSTSKGRVGALALVIIACGLSVAKASEAQVQLIQQKVIGDRAPHNAFTDLIRFQDRWFCIFREGRAHVSPDGKLRILTSTDGEAWTSTALLTHPAGDLRDPKLIITFDGRLMANGAVAFPHPKDGRTHQSLAWFSADGSKWSEPIPIGGSNDWLWRVTPHDQAYFSMGYSQAGPLKLYRSEDGRRYEVLSPDVKPGASFPNESSLVFLPGDAALCLLRQDPGPALLGRASAPYAEWAWSPLGQQIGGPRMIQLPDGRLLAGVRLLHGGIRTSLCWIDAETNALTECLELARGGDTSYPGLVFHENVLWVSYYSGPNIDSAKVYLAKVKIPPLIGAAE